MDIVNGGLLPLKPALVSVEWLANKVVVNFIFDYLFKDLGDYG